MMTNIYKIRCDHARFMMCSLDDIDILETMPRFQIQAIGQPLPFAWVAPKAAFSPSDNDDEVRPQITQWSPSDLIVQTQAYEALKPTLDASTVEVYPLAGEGANYLFLNPVARLGNDVVDLEETKLSYFDDGSFHDMERLALRSSQFDRLPMLFEGFPE